VVSTGGRKEKKKKKEKKEKRKRGLVRGGRCT
jgi:hypothetical protein